MNETVLLIDDDAGLLTLLQLGLEREGFSVITAKNGKEGIRQAYEHRPDVVVLDIMMAEMDGWTTCQRLRHVCDTPIIMLTAKTGGDDIIKGLSLGADDYLTKPCSFDELKARRGDSRSPLSLRLLCASKAKAYIGSKAVAWYVQGSTPTLYHRDRYVDDTRFRHTDRAKHQNYTLPSTICANIVTR